MSLSLVTSYPFWFISICIALGAGYAWLLYLFGKNPEFDRTFTRILFILRFLSVAIISFLLLSPMIRVVTKRTEKPMVVLALDQSSSLKIGKDSAAIRNSFLPQYEQLADKLSGKFDVIRYGFGENVTQRWGNTFEDNHTDFGKLFEEMRTRFSNRNLAAMVVASDGISTRGTDPVFAAENEKYSIYTVALGDTSQQKDLLIAKVNYNRIAYLGNTFPVEVIIMAHKCEGLQSKLLVQSDEGILFTQDIRISSGKQSFTVPINLNATKTGVQRFRLNLQPVKQELTTDNNYREIFIEVLDGRQKILILSSSPHPDIAALKAAIEKNQNFSVDVALSSVYNETFEPYNLVVLHQLPSVNDAGSQILAKLKQSNVPVMYILGAQTNIQAFNGLMEGLLIPPSNVSASAAYPIMNSDFGLFTVSDEVKTLLSEVPPLSVPFGPYKVSPSLHVLFNQKIGSINTSIPLLAFNQSLDKKSAIITGEGLWRWRMADYMKNGNHNASDELISKIVQYLSIRVDKSQFRVILKNYFIESENVEIEAELYNDSYELINEPDVTLTILNDEGKQFPYSFSRTARSYSLDAGSFPPGKYTLKAVTSYKGKAYEKNASFIVTAINEEALNTVADHNLLASLAGQHQGIMVHPDELDKLANQLMSRDDFVKISYTQKKYTDLVNLIWVFLLITALLAAEWFLRKYKGSY